MKGANISTKGASANKEFVINARRPLILRRAMAIAVDTTRMIKVVGRINAAAYVVMFPAIQPGLLLHGSMDESTRTQKTCSRLGIATAAAAALSDIFRRALRLGSSLKLSCFSDDDGITPPSNVGKASGRRRSIPTLHY